MTLFRNINMTRALFRFWLLSMWTIGLGNRNVAAQLVRRGKQSPRELETRFLTNPSLEVEQVTCPVGDVGELTTVLAVAIDIDISVGGLLDQDILDLEALMAFEINVQAYKNCDPYQRWVVAENVTLLPDNFTLIAGSDLELGPLAEDYFFFEVTFANPGGGVSTLLNVPETSLEPGFVDSDILSAEPCEIFAFFDIFDRSCPGDSCYCRRSLINQSVRGTTEDELNQGLNEDLDDFVFYVENREERTPLTFISNFTDVVELTSHTCEYEGPGASADRTEEYVVYWDLDPCTVYSEEGVINGLEDTITGRLNEIFYSECDGAFPRIYDAEILTGSYCDNPSFNASFALDDSCYMWTIRLSYKITEERPLFAEESARRRLQDSELPRMPRNLFTFEDSDANERFCFCSAFGPEPSTGPTVSVLEFAEELRLAMADILGSDVTSCDDAERAVQVTCAQDFLDLDRQLRDGSEISERGLVAQIETFEEYLVITGVNNLVNSTFEDYRRACLNYNQIVFNTCPLLSKHFFTSCEVIDIFEGLEDGVFNNRFVLKIEGEAAVSRSARDSYPFASILSDPFLGEGDGPIFLPTFGERNRALLPLETASSNRNLQHIFSIGDGLVECICSVDGAALPSFGPPTAESVFGTVGEPFDEIIFVEQQFCAEETTGEQDIYVAVDNPAVDPSTLLVFLQDFFNDLAIHICTTGYPIVYFVEELGDTGIDGVFWFRAYFFAYNFEFEDTTILYDPTYNSDEIFECCGTRHLEEWRLQDDETQRKLDCIECCLDCRDRRLEEKTHQNIQANHDPRKLKSTQRQLVQEPCFCERKFFPGISFDDLETRRLMGSSTSVPNLLEVNDYLFQKVKAGALDGFDINKIQFLAELETVFDQDTSNVTCTEPIEETREVTFGIRVDDELSEAQQLLIGDSIWEAFVSRRAKNCVTQKAIMYPGNNSFIGFVEADNIALFRFSLTIRNPTVQFATEPPEDPGVRQLSSGEGGALLYEFCTIDEILNGTSVLDECAVDGVCGNCGQTRGSPGCDCEECEQAVCAQDNFCCVTSFDSICVEIAESTPICLNDISCVCPYDGCYCPIGVDAEGVITEEDLSNEFNARIQAISIETSAPSISRGDGDFRRLATILQGPVDLTEYTQQDCSALTAESFALIVVVYIDRDPETLTPEEIEELEIAVGQAINLGNSNNCEPSFTIAQEVIFLGSGGGSRRQMSENERRLDTWDTSFLVDFLGDPGASSEFTFGSSFRRGLEELAFEEEETEIDYVTRVNFEGRQLVTQVVDGVTECYCPTHGSNTGQFLTTAEFTFFFNQLQNTTTAGAALAFNGTTCDNSTLVDVSSILTLTLTKPFSDLTDDEKFEITTAFIQSHTEQTLEDCGEGAIFVTDALLVPFPLLEADPPSPARRELLSFTGGNGAAIYTFGTTSSLDFGLGDVGAGGSWYPSGSFRRGLEQKRKHRFLGDRTLQGRELAETAVCFCSDNEEEGTPPDLDQIVADINAALGETLIQDAAEVALVPCEGGFVVQYLVTIEFSGDPTEEQQLQFTQIFIAECNYQSSVQCDAAQWILDKFELTGKVSETRRRELLQQEGPETHVRERELAVFWEGEATVIDFGLGDTGSSGEVTFTWLTPGRRILMDGLSAEIHVSPRAPARMRELQTGTGILIGNNTRDVNCTCLRTNVNASGYPLMPGDVTVPGLNGGLSDLLDASNFALAVAEIDIGTLAPTTSSPTSSPTTSSPTSSPTPKGIFGQGIWQFFNNFPPRNPTPNPTNAPTPEPTPEPTNSPIEMPTSQPVAAVPVSTNVAWSTLFETESFENGWGGVWQDGGGASIREGAKRVSSGIYSVRLVKQNSIFTESFSVTNAQEIRVSFYFFARGMEIDDYFVLEANSGSGWMEKGSLEIGGSDGIELETLTQKIITFSTEGVSDIQLRFRQDASSNTKQIFLDDIKVELLQPSTQTSSSSNAPTPTPTLHPTQAPTGPQIQDWQNVFVDDFAIGLGNWTCDAISGDDCYRTGNDLFVQNDEHTRFTLRLRGKGDNSYTTSTEITLGESNEMQVMFKALVHTFESGESFSLQWSNDRSSFPPSQTKTWTMGVDFLDGASFLQYTHVFQVSGGSTYLRFVNNAPQYEDRLFLNYVVVDKRKNGTL